MVFGGSSFSIFGVRVPPLLARVSTSHILDLESPSAQDARSVANSSFTDSVRQQHTPRHHRAIILTEPGSNHGRTRAARNAAHAQVYPQPSPRPQADGRVSLPSRAGRRFVSDSKMRHHTEENEADREFWVLVMSYTPAAPTPPRTRSATSSLSSTRHPRTRSPSSDSAHSSVVESRLDSVSSTTRPRP